MAETASESLLWVGCYTEFDNLAHAPRGKTSEHSIVTVRLNEETGAMTEVSSLAKDACLNPAFMRHHPTRNVLYAATESINEAGDVVAYAVDASTGALTEIGKQTARGASTCYLTIAPDRRNMLFVNYWDSTLGVLPLDADGLPEPARSVQPADRSRPVRAGGLAEHLANRQSEPHAHAIVLEPAHGKIAFVPDLGTDQIRQFVFDPAEGALRPAGKLACAPREAGPHGPRYIEFDPRADAAYVVNELSSTVSVFRFDRAAAQQLLDEAASGALDEARCPDVLFLVGIFSTRPSNPPPTKNTCGRIAVDPTGNFVLVSNRGDDSIAVFRIDRDGPFPTLRPIEIFSTMGKCPRHFQFAPSGRFVIAANQDSNNLASFALDAATGHLAFTGHEYACASPNFVAAQPAALRPTQGAEAVPAAVPLGQAHSVSSVEL